MGDPPPVPGSPLPWLPLLSACPNRSAAEAAIQEQVAAAATLKPGSRVYMKPAGNGWPGGWGDFLGLMMSDFSGTMPVRTIVALEDYKPNEFGNGALVEFDAQPPRSEIYQPTRVAQGILDAERLDDQDPRRLLRDRTATKLLAEIETLRAETNKKIDELNGEIVRLLLRKSNECSQTDDAATPTLREAIITVLSNNRETWMTAGNIVLAVKGALPQAKPYSITATVHAIGSAPDSPVLVRKQGGRNLYRIKPTIPGGVRP